MTKIDQQTEPTTDEISTDANNNGNSPKSGQASDNGALDLPEPKKDAGPDDESASPSGEGNSTLLPASAPSKMAGKNALCHGVFSSDIVLPWESADEFKSLHASFKDEWKPSGCSEEQAVLELTHHTWIGWRAAKLANLQFHQASLGRKPIKPGELTFQDMVGYNRETPEVAAKTLKTIDQLLQTMSAVFEDVRDHPYDTNTTEGKATQSKLLQLGHDVTKSIDFTKEVGRSIHSLIELMTKLSALYEKAYQPDEIERQVRLLAAVDARIEKVLRRLMTIKEYKRIAAAQSSPRLIESPSVTPGAEPAGANHSSTFGA